VTAAVTTDEIYQRYLDKAIREILRLEHEVAEAAAGKPVAQPTGHPLGTIFLVKYGPQAQELQEGVAFHGRAGHALKRSLERLRVDPREVFGTNCVKFAGADEDVCRGWLKREVRIVQPKLVVIMGEDAPEFVNSLEFPLSRPLEATLGVLQRFTPTIEALCVPDIDSSLDEQAAKTRYWNAFKPIGDWWAAQPPY
jgi:uracil-DNA glycosylase family 4